MGTMAEEEVQGPVPSSGDDKKYATTIVRPQRVVDHIVKHLAAIDEDTSSASMVRIIRRPL